MLKLKIQRQDVVFDINLQMYIQSLKFNYAMMHAIFKYIKKFKKHMTLIRFLSNVYKKLNSKNYNNISAR